MASFGTSTWTSYTSWSTSASTGKGSNFFPEGFEYVNAPTEVEAYRHCIAEGRRLGMTDAELYKYLKVEWIDEKEVRKLAKNVGVKAPAVRKKRKR